MAEIDAHIHTWVSDKLEEKKEIEGVPVNEEAHQLYLSELFDERLEETDQYMAVLAEHDGRVENEVYTNELVENDYDVDDHGTYITAEKDGKQAVAIIGAQVNAHNEYGVQKDVIATGIQEDVSFSADTPEELYEEAVNQSEGVIVTHIHAMPEHLPAEFDPKWMNADDAGQVLDTASDYNTPVAIGRPTAYMAPTNWLMHRNWLQGDTVYDRFTDIPVLNEFDLHDIADIPRQNDRAINTNLVPEEVFGDFITGEPDYEELFEQVEPQEPRLSYTNVKKLPRTLMNQAQYRLVPAKKGWKPK